MDKSKMTCPTCGFTYDTELVPGLEKGCPKCMASFLMDETEVMNSEDERGFFSRLKPGDRIQDMEILSFIGRGGMGYVYKARQHKLDRDVALKILDPTLAESEAFTSRFNREAKALASLNHPNIVQIYDFGQDDGCYYLAMEFIDGVSLRHVMNTERMAPETALRYVPQICNALEYAHGQGVIHRDIKPENILIDTNGNLKIADFGLAKMTSQPEVQQSFHTRTGDVMGTPHYMAPEQVRETSTVDHRADIYSLGVVFYEMLTGDLPIGRFPAPSESVQVSVQLDEVVLKALEKDPERRYQLASQVREDVTRNESLGAAEELSPHIAAVMKKFEAIRLRELVAIVCAAFSFVLVVHAYQEMDYQPYGIRSVEPFFESEVYRFFYLPIAFFASFAVTAVGLRNMKEIRMAGGGDRLRFGLSAVAAFFYPLVWINLIVFFILPRMIDFEPTPRAIGIAVGIGAAVIVCELVVMGVLYRYLRDRINGRGMAMIGLIVAVTLIHMGGVFASINYTRVRMEARLACLELNKALDRVSYEGHYGTHLDDLLRNPFGSGFLKAMNKYKGLLAYDADRNATVVIITENGGTKVVFNIVRHRSSRGNNMGIPDQMQIHRVDSVDGKIRMEYSFPANYHPKMEDMGPLSPRWKKEKKYFEELKSLFGIEPNVRYQYSADLDTWMDSRFDWINVWKTGEIID